MRNVKHLSVILTLLLTVGCASRGTRTELVDGMDLEEQLELYVDDYLEQVLLMCKDAHDQYQQSQGVVDCGWAIKLEAMYVSVPNASFQDRWIENLAEWKQHWCASASSKTTNREIYFVIYWRESDSVNTLACWPSEMAAGEGKK